MQITRKVRAQLLAQGSLYTVLLLVLVMLLAWVAREYRAEWDVTANARNTLSQGTQDALRQFDGPVNVTAYAMARDGSNDVHKLLQEKLRPWQRVKPDLAVTMVDPRDDPKRANAAGLRSPNELVIEHKGRTEHLPVESFNEQNFVNALIRLSRTTTTVVYWLDGHGERKLDGIANNDLGEFGRQLQMKGYKFSNLNLSIAQDVPRNAAALVIASPQTDLQDAEVARVRAFIEAGGNLLWLIDPEPLHGLDPIAEYLGLVLTPGTVVDPSIKPRSGPPTLAVGSNYARHPVTGSFRLNTLFPGSRQIGAAEREGWRMTPLIDVAQRGWVETGKLDDKPIFDEAHDFRGPVNIAMAFERTAGDRQ
ncbi:MAG TPA: GldG family protein, partial [Burkholderiales bacterium]|nr:GldG family protein [Burkholderiales bacterium]